MKKILASIVMSMALIGCMQDPKKIVVPEKFESIQQMQEFSEKIKDLPKEDRDLLGQYIIGDLSDGVKRIDGTTVGEAIEAQRQYNARKKQEEDRRKTQEVQAKAEHDKLKQQLARAATVAITDKYLESGNREEFDINDYIITQIVLKNNSQKSIKAIKGKIVFRNSFDDVIKSIPLSVDNLNLQPNDVQEMTNREVMLPGIDNNYKDADLANLKIMFEAEQIIFADGSKLALTLQPHP